MYAVLRCTTVEGFTRTEISPFWIQHTDLLKQPEDNCDETFEWLFFEDRNHLMMSGY